MGGGAAGEEDPPQGARLVSPASATGPPLVAGQGAAWVPTSGGGGYILQSPTQPVNPIEVFPVAGSPGRGQRWKKVATLRVLIFHSCSKSFAHAFSKFSVFLCNFWYFCTILSIYRKYFVCSSISYTFNYVVLLMVDCFT